MPPTINKYYVLDLAPERSLVEYLVAQGQQVFMVSWRNPDQGQSHFDLDTYAAALLEVYGQTVVPPRTGRPGRPRGAYKVPPEDLLYAVVHKRRQHGRVVEVTTHVVYGTPARLAQVLAASPGSRVISTFGVERNHLTIRQHARRMGRKVHAFSKDHTYLEHHLAFAYYHFVVPHRGLRQRWAQPLPTKGSGSLTRWM